MPSNGTQQRMGQVMSAIASGTGGTALSQGARQWLLVRYTKWLGTRGIRGNDQTPEEAWSQYESGFIGKFTEIGQRAAELSGGDEIDENTVETAARTVETETSALSPCPFCVPPDWA